MGIPIVDNSAAVGLKNEMKIDVKNTAGGVTFLSRSLTKADCRFWSTRRCKGGKS